MILFLDFDGVLHSSDNALDPLFCRNEFLWQVLRAKPEIEIVFSTSWREIHSLDELVRFATLGGGEDLAHRFIGHTPKIKVPRDRRDMEIQSWLKTHRPDAHWIAVDDMPELFNGSHPNLHVVGGGTGLTDADVLAILKHGTP